MLSPRKVISVAALLGLALVIEPAHGDTRKCVTKQYGTSSVTLCDEGADPSPTTQQVPQAPTGQVDLAPRSIGSTVPPVSAVGGSRPGNDTESTAHEPGADNEPTEAVRRAQEEALRYRQQRNRNAPPNTRSAPRSPR